METSNLSCLGVGTATSQGNLEESRISGLCSSRMLMGPNSSSGSIQSCDVVDLLGGPSTGAGHYLSPTTTTTATNCTLKCSVTVAVHSHSSSFRPISGPEINISASSKSSQAEDLIRNPGNINQRTGKDEESDNNSSNLFSPQEGSQINEDLDEEEDEEGDEDGDSDFDGLDLHNDDHDPVPLGEILDKLQANISPNYPHSSAKGNAGNLIRLHAAHEDNDSPTISATVNVAALDLSDPDSIYRHLSQLNDTVLRVSAKDSSPTDSGQQSPIPFIESPTLSTDVIPTPSISSPRPVSPLSSAIIINTVGTSMSSSIDVQTINTEGKTTHPESSNKQTSGNKNSFLPNSIQLPTSPLALAVTCPTLSPTVLPSGTSSSSASDHIPASPNILIKTSTNSSLATKSSPQSCAICFKVFSNASALAKHRLTHSEERRYHCNICSKAFKRQDHLNGHLLTHRSTKPFACQVDGCGKSYCDARSLRRHKENHHSSGVKHHHQNNVVSIPQITLSPTTALTVTTKDDQAPQETSNSMISRSTVGDTKIMFSSKGLTAQQLQLIEQLLKESRGGKIVSLPQNPVIASLPQNPSLNVSFPLPQNPVTPTTNVSSPKVSPMTSLSNTGQRRGPSLDKGLCTSSPEKPVECTICNRKFKNIPALNGHMRLHGGYYKKDSEGRRISTTTSLKHNIKGAKYNVLSKPSLKRKCTTMQQECSVGKKISLCPANLQSSLSSLQPVTPLIVPTKPTLSGGNIQIVKSANQHQVPFGSQECLQAKPCSIPQPSLAFQSLPPPDTNKLLENLEKKNFGTLSMKNEQLQQTATYEGFSGMKDKTPKSKATGANLSKGIGTKEHRIPDFGETKPVCKNYSALTGRPPISLPTKPIPQLQLEKAKQCNSIADVKSFLQNPIPVQHLSATCEPKHKKKSLPFVEEDTKKQIQLSTLPLHPAVQFSSSPPDLHSEMAQKEEKNCTKISNQYMNESNFNQFPNSTSSSSFLDSFSNSSSFSQLIQTSSCNLPFYPVSHSPALSNLKSHQMLKVDQKSDKTPKIGPEYQALIPEFPTKMELSEDQETNDQLVWCPHTTSEVTIHEYLLLASSCAVHLGSHNEELALELLQRHSGRIIDAVQDLVSHPTHSKVSAMMADADDTSIDTEYDYESEEGFSDMDFHPPNSNNLKMKSLPWTEVEVNGFYEGLVKYRKNFAKISQQIGTKTVKECVEFYYLWKNFCHDESSSFKSIFNAQCSGNNAKFIPTLEDPSGREVLNTQFQGQNPESTST